MRDHVDLRLFPKEGRDFVRHLTRPVVGLISADCGGRTTEQALVEHRRIDTACCDFDTLIAYGTAARQERSCVLFNADWKDKLALTSRLAELAGSLGLPGYVIGSSREAFFVGQDRDVHPLPPFDGTANCLDNWLAVLYPGFSAQGYFPRQHLYVQAKLCEHRLGYDGPFGDRQLGETFHVHAGSGGKAKDLWVRGRKVGPDKFLRDDGVELGVSQWTKTKTTLNPKIDVLRSPE